MSKRSEPSNIILYNKIKSQAKKKFKTFPSAYASGWIVREYIRQGGKYKGKKSEKSLLNRWYKEKWIDVCKLPKIVSCGRKKLSSKNWKSKYPYCRPSIRINKSTPRTSSEISKKELKRRCSKKRKSPLKRLLVKNK